MKKAVVGMGVAAMLAVSSFGARYVIPAPDGVGDVVALTNALLDATITATYSEYALEPGVYDLRGIAMEADSHLVLPAAKRMYGLGGNPGDTVLLGGGSAVGKRILRMTCYNDYYTVVSNLTLTGGYIGGTKNGGAISGGSTAIIRHCILTNNICGGYWQEGGGAIYVGRAENCFFADNKAGSSGTGGGGGSHGGGLYCTSTYGIHDKPGWQGAYDCVFSNCYAQSQGGGAHNATCVNCKFYVCSANYGGGADGGRLVDCEFIGNKSLNGMAGGAYNPVCVTNCVFKDNYTSYEFAGGLWTKGDVPVIGCLFEGNSCNREGGGLCCRGGLISNCVFRCNVSRAATGGGGLFAPDREATELSPTFKVVDCVFEGNVAQVGNGGGAIAPGGFVNCLFRTNSCPSGGGGVYCESASPCGGFEGCTFEGNRVTGWAHGGGILSTYDANRTVLTGCTFASNSVGAYGSAAACATLVRCVVTNHLGVAYALCNCNLDGCYIVGNVTGKEGGLIVDAVRTDCFNWSASRAVYTNVNCVFEGNYTYLASITSKTNIINCTFRENIADSGWYATIVPPDALIYNSVFVDNMNGPYYKDFCDGDSDRPLPFLVNCTWSASDKDPDAYPDRCTGCRKASLSQLRFTKEFAAERPYEPRSSSPLFNAAYAPDWIKAAVGALDCYGNPRTMFDGLDIGAAECQSFGPGCAILIR